MPTDLAGASKPLPPPLPKKLPTGPPVPALQAIGFDGSIHDFNDRVDAVVAAHQQARGTRPTPGVALDLARSSVPVEHFGPMFQAAPQTRMQARSHAALALHGPTIATTPETHPDPDRAQAHLLAKALDNVHTPEQLDAFLDPSNHGMLFAALKGPDSRIVQAAWVRAKRRADVVPQTIAQQGFSAHPGGFLDRALGIAGLGASQIVEGLVHSPGALYGLGKTIVKGDVGVLTANEKAQQEANVEIGAVAKGTIASVKQDVLHPGDRPGFLLMDILGFAAPATRLAAGGRALAAGEGLNAAELAATRRAGGTVAIGREGAKENVLLSENPFVAAAQRYRLEHRQAKLDLTTANGEKQPSGLLSILAPNAAKDFLDEHFSFESKIGREADARRRVDHIVDTSAARELDHATGNAVAQARVFSRMPSKLRRGLTRGEQKAIQTLSFGVTPEEQIAFHRRMIEGDVGDSKAHLRQIADLKLAKKILANPDPRGRFKQALELTQQVVVEMERRKVDELGLSPVTRETRIGKPGETMGVPPAEPPMPHVSTGTEGVGSLPDLAGPLVTKDRSHLYHRTSLGALDAIREKGLTPGKPAGGEEHPPGVYFANEPLQARGLSWKRKENVYLRVARSKVQGLQERAHGESLTSHHVPASDLEFLGADGKWHPVLAARGSTAEGFPATGPVEPFYTKLEPRGKRKRPPSDRVGFYQTKPGPFGIPAPTKPAELTHEFTGKAITAGDFRIDATNLTSEAYARTVRAATVLNEHSRLWASATDTPKTRFDIPIRDSKTIPDKLRSVLANMDEGVMTDKEAALLPSDMRTLLEELYPPLERAQREKIEGVKWIDGRTIGAANEIPSRPGAFVKATEMVNEPIRAAILFLRPAYALNALGNAGMLAFHQGYSAVPSMARSLGAKGELGEATVRTIDALMGQGRARSYTTAITPKLSHGLAQSWNLITDQAFRRSSFLYEARQQGYVTAEDIRGLVKDGGKDLVEIKRRANKAMVEFDNLTPFEKNTLRHIIFVYPWVSRSAVYTLRSVVEHPGKIDALAQLGQQEADSDPIFKNAPEWFKRTGYFPVGWTADGKPKVVNPTSINSFSTLGELTAVIGGGFGATKYAAFQDLLGPLPSLAVHGVTGKDQYGNDYPSGDWIGAAKEVLGSLPEVSAYKRGGKKTPAAKTVDPTRRSSIVSSFNSALKRTVFTPGWLDGYGSLLAGGLSSRGVDIPALEARYWRDATPEQRHRNELTLLDSALTIQADLLKASVPGEVRKGVKVGSDLDFAYKTFARDTGRPPTAKERAGLLIDHLEAKGLLPDGAAAKFKTQLEPLVAEQDINHLRTVVFDKYGGGDALRQWDDDVRLVASFKKPVFDQKTRSLYQQGLVRSPSPSVSQDALYEYGRKFLQFTRKVTGIQDQIKAGNATAADLRAFEDANDKPVGRLPSFVRTAWSYLPADQQKQAVASSAVTAWSALSSFEKELLGQKADAKITAGWAKLGDVVATQKAALARQGESFPAGYKQILAQYVQRYFDAPGLVKDFDFARKPLYARLEAFKPIRQSPNAEKWTELLSVAKTYGAYLKSPDYDKAQVRQMWRDYVAKTVEPWVASDKSFADELQGYGKNVLGKLIGA